MCQSAPLTLATVDDTLASGRQLGRAIGAGPLRPVIIYLRGDLGAGKTTLARGVLQGLGHRGRVPSPTYTLIEPYELGERRVYHVDLYRLTRAAEALELGLMELPECGVVMLIEWPERAPGALPQPDLELELDIADIGRALHSHVATEAGREVWAAACSMAGERT